MPSEYFRENIYVTFQDDWVAFKMTDLMNVERLMWANDFPHSRRHVAVVAGDAGRAHRPPHRAEKRRILHDNVAELYGLGPTPPTPREPTDV